MLNSLAHIFTPRKSNNYRARLLHKSSLLVLMAVFVGFNFLIRVHLNPSSDGQVLGYAANISPEEVIRLTNEKRAQNGLPALTENGILSRAALAKGTDMFNKGYWAHVAPDGTTPWSFFIKFGYSYKYAGENLARDFTNASSTVDAWMASPTHRENLLNSKYKEIGVAVLDGNLAGADTTLVVQFFGTKLGDSLPIAPVAAVHAAETNSNPTPSPTHKPVAVATALPVAALTTPVVSPIEQKSGGLGVLSSNSLSVAKVGAYGILGVLLIVLVVDSFVVRRHGVVRIGGRTLAHISFLGMVLALVIMYSAGRIL